MCARIRSAGGNRYRFPPALCVLRTGLPRGSQHIPMMPSLSFRAGFYFPLPESFLRISPRRILRGDGFGQLVHKFDDARILVGCGDPLDVLLQLRKSALRRGGTAWSAPTVALTIWPRLGSGTP
jgi:hypothetical protein